VAKPAKEKETASGGLAQALKHPTRFAILIAMTTPPRRLSPSDYAKESGKPLNHCGYHFRVLADSGCIELVKTEAVRGSFRHSYEPVKTALAWSKEWESLGSYVKQVLCASVLRGGVEAIGNAIDSGSFENKENAHLSYDTMRVDDQGWQQVTMILDRSLRELMQVEDESKERESEANPLFLATYLMSSFESPPLGSPRLCDG
jgi:hypothetical protein